MPQTLPPSRRNLNPTRHLNGEDPAWGLSCWEEASDHTATARLAVPLGLGEGCSPWHRDSGRTPVWPRQGRVGQEAPLHPAPCRPVPREAAEGPMSRAQRGGLRQRREGGAPHAAQAGDRQGLSTGLSSLSREPKQAETSREAGCPVPT